MFRIVSGSFYFSCIHCVQYCSFCAFTNLQLRQNNESNISFFGHYLNFGPNKMHNRDREEYKIIHIHCTNREGNFKKMGEIYFVSHFFPCSPASRSIQRDKISLPIYRETAQAPRE